MDFCSRWSNTIFKLVWSILSKIWLQLYTSSLKNRSCFYSTASYCRTLHQGRTFSMPSEPSPLGSTQGPKVILHQPYPFRLLEIIPKFWIKIQKTFEFTCYIDCEIKWKCEFACSMRIHTLPEVFMSLLWLLFFFSTVYCKLHGLKGD